MRANMEPLTPATTTLAPAISHIAETAASLAKERAKSNAAAAASQSEIDGERKRNEVETVRWVLDAPTRLKQYLENGHKQEAEDEWGTISGVLDKWKGVSGTAEVRRQCEEVLQRPVATNGTDH